MRRFGVASFALSLTLVASLIIGELPAGATNSAQVKRYGIAAADLGAGWSAALIPPWRNRSEDCMTPLAPPKRLASAISAYQETSWPGLFVVGTLATGRTMASLYKDTVRHYARCRSIDFSDSGIKATGIGRRVPLQLQGVESSGFQFQLHVRAKITSIGVQLASFENAKPKVLNLNAVVIAVTFHDGNYMGTLTLVAPAMPNDASLRSFLGALANLVIANLQLAVLTGGKAGAYG
jgi:hypothetical protein